MSTNRMYSVILLWSWLIGFASSSTLVQTSFHRENWVRPSVILWDPYSVSRLVRSLVVLSINYFRMQRWGVKEREYTKTRVLKSQDSLFVLTFEREWNSFSSEVEIFPYVSWPDAKIAYSKIPLLLYSNTSFLHLN